MDDHGNHDIESDKGFVEVAEPTKLITAVVQRGKADGVVHAAIDAGAEGATIVFGRGQGVRERLGLLGLGIQPEKEVIYIVVEEHLLDSVLNAIANAGNFEHPGVGLVFVTPVDHTIGLMRTVQRDESTSDSHQKPGRFPFLRRR